MVDAELEERPARAGLAPEAPGARLQRPGQGEVQLGEDDPAEGALVDDALDGPRGAEAPQLVPDEERDSSLLAGGAGTKVKLTIIRGSSTAEPHVVELTREAPQTVDVKSRQQGGGIGHDFSTLRPKGAPVKGVGADASGPLSFMDVWDGMCRTIMSAGARSQQSAACGAKSRVIWARANCTDDFISGGGSVGRTTLAPAAVTIRVRSLSPGRTTTRT